MVKNVLTDILFDPAVQKPAALVLQPVANHHAVRTGFVVGEFSVEHEHIGVILLAWSDGAKTLTAFVRRLGFLNRSSQQLDAFNIINHAHD
jgi:hypothetical protein